MNQIRKHIKKIINDESYYRQPEVATNTGSQEMMNLM